MRSTKKILLTALALMLIVACLLGITSCKKHEHEYTATVTDPTCTEAGFTTYTCECGDSYTGDEVPAAHAMATVAASAATCTQAGWNEHNACSVCGYSDDKVEIPVTAHNYVSTITTYPTVSTAGVREHKCGGCGASYTTAIDAFTVSLPDFAAMLADVIGDASYTLGIDEAAQIAYVTELTEYTDRNGSKLFSRIEVARATVSGKNGVLTGEIAFKLSLYTVAITDTATDPKTIVYSNTLTPDSTFELSVIVNGNDVSVEVINDGVSTESEAKVDELIYAMIGEMIGADAETAAELIYFMGQATELAPLLVELAETIATIETPTISEEYIEDLAELFALVGRNIIKITTDTNGNTVYTVDPLALKAFLAEIEGKTVAEYLAEVYGEDVVGQLTDFIASLPDLTVREIANAAIDFSEAAGVDVDDIYTLIDTFLKVAGGVEISIEKEINDRYNYTIIDIIAEINGMDEAAKNQAKAQLKGQIDAMIESIESLTFDQLFNLYVGADSEFSITEQLDSAIDMLAANVSIVITFDEYGNLVSIDTTIAERDLNVTVDADEVVISLTWSDDELRVTVDADGILIQCIDNGIVFATGILSVTEEIVGADTVVTVTADFTENTYEDYLDFTATVVNGEVTELDFEIRGYNESDVLVPELQVEYEKSPNGAELVIWLGEDDAIAITYETGNDSFEATLIVLDGTTTVATATLNATAETVGEETTVTITGDIKGEDPTTEDYLDFVATVVNGEVTELYLQFSGYDDEIFRPYVGVYYSKADSTFIFGADDGEREVTLEVNDVSAGLVVRDDDNELFKIGFVLDDVTGDLIYFILNVNDYEYDDQLEASVLVEKFHFLYQDTDNEEGLDNLYIEFMDHTVSIDYGTVGGENKMIITVNESDVIEVAITRYANGYCFDIYYAENSEVMADMSITLYQDTTVTDKIVYRADVDVDHLYITSYEWFAYDDINEVWAADYTILEYLELFANVYFEIA